MIRGYQVLEWLGPTAGSRICRGRRLQDQAFVLLKVPQSGNAAAAQIDRFRREFELLQSLNVPGILKPIAFIVEHEESAMVVEDFPGESLETVLHQQRLDVAACLRLGVALTQSLSGLHSAHVVHGDIRPANIFITPERGACLVDLSLTARHNNESLCSISAAHGDWAYLSPEQTGRMNRPVDYRTDFYSLGVVLYRMLTGVLPFVAADPLEWAHCHIARAPRPPKEISPEIPQAVSDIVMKLLAKVAEERYQSAQGLQFDLEQCLVGAQPFALGAQDFSDRFQISPKLYGREAELATLLSAFERMTTLGQPEWILASGYSGIGKSSLVHELHKPILAARGAFISGKFDQQKRNIPYATLTQAFRGLVQQILSESEERIVLWRQTLRNALGVNGQLIVDVIPPVELIIGPQAPVLELGPAEAQNRFHSVFRQFIGVFTRKEHPLTLFLDDLQWADSASLKLLKDLMTHPEICFLLVVGAYRDNEVDAAHPLALALDEAKKNGASISHIVLRPLSQAHLAALIADTLHCESNDFLPLVNLIHQKTAGNPFFTMQFLTTLYEEHLIEFDQKTRRWRWDVNKIDAMGYTDNVADLMVEKLKRLSTKTQEILKQVACLGNAIDIATLAMVHGSTAEEIDADLLEAVRSGLILKADDEYRFLHDRVQEAAYSLIPETHRAEMHLRIGRNLLAHSPESTIEKKIYDITNQLNHGVEWITDPDEKETLRRLNVQAGKKALASIAYAPALNYLNQAAALLPSNAWNALYEETLALYLEQAECEYLVGNFARADSLFNLILANAGAHGHRSRAYSLRIRLYQVAGRYDEALTSALEALQCIGVTCPESKEDLQSAIKAELDAIPTHMRGRRIADLVDAPEIADVDMRAVISLLVEAMPCAYIARPSLFPLLALKALNVSLQHGNTRESCFAYSCYGIMLVATFGDIPSAFEFSEVSLRLNDRFNDAKLKGTLLFMHASFINPWRNPLKTSRPMLDQAFIASLDVGDLVYASYNACNAVWHAVERGDPLPEVLLVAEKYKAFTKQSKNELVYSAMRQYEQFVAALQGRTQRPTSLDDNAFDEAECLAGFVKAGFGSGIFFHHLLKQALAFIHEQYVEALEAALRAAPMLNTVMGATFEASHQVLQALTLTALYRQVSPPQQQAFNQILEDTLQKLKLWAVNCPENHLSNYALVSAEVARVRGESRDAMRLYDQAIGSARENSFLHKEALACEFAAKFYRSEGFELIADMYLREAHSSYARWGAVSKTRQIDARFPQLHEEKSRLRAETHGANVEQLDALAIAKASQAISGHIVLNQLMDTLMRIVIENAGAQRGYLLLASDDWLSLAAEASADQEEVYIQTNRERLREIARERTDADQDIPENTLPSSILAYVRRSRDRVILTDAAEPNPFSADEYFSRRRPKSVLCLPILRQNELVGLLYLENNLLTHAFTPDRLAVLELIAAQAAISLDNARLYANLEHENHERKRAEEGLRKAEEKYRSIFEHAVEGIFQSAADGTLLTVNPAMAHMLGFDSPETLIEKNANLGTQYFVEPEQWKRFQQTLEENGGVQEFVTQVHRGQGNHIWLSLNARSVRDASGDIAFYEGTAEDITERKLAEANAQRLIREEAARQEADITNRKLQQWVAELEQRNREMARLGEMVGLLQTCATAQAFSDIVSRQLPQLLEDIDGGLYLFNQEENLLKRVATCGSSPPLPEDFPIHHCWALQLRRLHAVEGEPSELLCRHVPPGDLRYVCLPLIAQGETLGVLHVHPRPGQALKERYAFLQTVVENLALGLANIRLREALSQQAFCDPLTGLYNRRFMDESLEHELHRAARRAAPLSVMMVDIDHFKQLNDTYGHDAGDTILKEMAGFIKGRIRSSDVACRYGGEEMLIILPDTPLAEATKLAETLRIGVHNLSFHTDASVGPVTISLGVAASSTHRPNGKTLLRAADIALYQAKRQGRDRVVVADGSA